MLSIMTPARKRRLIFALATAKAVHICGPTDTGMDLLVAASLTDRLLDDGVLFYRVLGARAVPWPQVPKGPFLAAWFALPAERRRRLVAKHGFYAAELDEDRWAAHLLARDDVCMLMAVAAVVSKEALDGPPMAGQAATLRDPRAFIERGAVQCLSFLARCNDWGDDWAPKVQPLSYGNRIRTTACTLAAKHGHLDMLRLLRARGCDWDAVTCAKAAAGGHLGCLVYLYERGCPWDARTSAYAALGGHLAVLKYAHERDCPWDAWTCAWAARNGHLACIEFAHTRGCPIDRWTCSNAEIGGFTACADYARRHGVSWNGWKNHDLMPQKPTPLLPLAAGDDDDEEELQSICSTCSDLL